jgi:AcrR family transcriptional regulator
MKPHDDGGTRERILSVAAKLFAARGYHGTHLHLIATAVGIQKASLFHHFPSKGELYRAVLERNAVEVATVIRAVLESERGSEDRVRDLVSTYVGLVALDPERAKLLLRLSLGDAAIPASYGEIRRIVAAVADFVAEGQRRGVFRALDPIALVIAVVGMVAFFFTTAEFLAPAWMAAAERTARIENAVTEIALRALQVGTKADGEGGPAFPGAVVDQSQS